MEGNSARVGAEDGPRPDPRLIRSFDELSNALSVISRRAGFTVRGLAERTGIKLSTLSGYLNGSHPRVQDRGRIRVILQACGVVEPEEAAVWETVVDRLYGLDTWIPEDTAWPNHTAERTLDLPVVSLRAPVERLQREPRMRGRETLFKHLTEATGLRDGPRVHVLHGLGGVGKSFLALSLAKWAITKGISTWWCSAGETVSVPLAMRSLIQMLGARPRQSDVVDLADTLWHLLDNYRRPWLLVIDNADEPARDLSTYGDPVADATGWLRPPSGRYGMIVVTTRDGSPATWGGSPDWIHLHRIRPLGAGNAAAVLQEVAGAAAGTREEAIEVAVRLGGLPLALNLAGRHLREARAVPSSLAGPTLTTTFTDYTRALEEGRHEEVLKFAQPPRPRRARIDQTWELSLEALESREFSEARTVLALLSCLSNAIIPYALLLEPEVLAASPLFSSADGVGHMSGYRLFTVLQAMSGLGLVDLRADPARDDLAEHTLVLHPVLRAVYRRRVETGSDFDDFIHLIVGLLDQASRDLYPSDPASWRRWRAIAAHCHSPLGLLVVRNGQEPSAEFRAALRPGLSAAQFLRASECLGEAESAYAVLHEYGERALGPDHPDLLAIRQGLCRVWLSVGRWEQAESGLRALLETRCAVLGSEHADTLATRHYLARVRFNQGDTTEAEQLFRAVLTVRRRVLGHSHPATLSTLSNLGVVWQTSGRTALARRTLEIVLRIRRRTLGDDYPATLITRSHLAQVRLDEGVTVEDEAEFRALAVDTGRVLGANHTRTLSAGYLLGEALVRLGQPVEARHVLVPILATRRCVLGDDHPLSLRTAALLNQTASRDSVLG